MWIIALILVTILLIIWYYDRPTTQTNQVNTPQQVNTVTTQPVQTTPQVNTVIPQPVQTTQPIETTVVSQPVNTVISQPVQTTQSVPLIPPSMDPVTNAMYIGCFADTSPSIFPNQLPATLIYNCRGLARAAGSQIFAMQNGNSADNTGICLYGGPNTTKATVIGQGPATTCMVSTNNRILGGKNSNALYYTN